MINVQLIADNISASGDRISTFVLEYPRYIHSELKTHRVFSTNSASSRAIPLDIMIELVKANTVYPQWTLNQSGMQGIPVTNEITQKQANAIWDNARDAAIKYVRELQKLGIHKQNANRLLEPFQHIKTIVTGTEFSNFFRLRISEEAQPEIRELAEKMKKALDKSEPRLLGENEVHCPFAKDGVAEYNDMKTIFRSVALCAQVSYRKENSDEQVIRRIINRLLNSKNLHASPFEHIALPANGKHLGNLTGFHQLRHKIEYLKYHTFFDMSYDKLIDRSISIWS